MFKKLMISIQRNMSTAENKSKQTLAKKLSRKRVTPALITQQKREVVLKPELFCAVKLNNKNTKVATTSKKNDVLEADQQEKPKKKTTARVKADPDKDDNTAVETKHTRRVTKTKNYREDIHEGPLEVVSAGGKTQLKVEPCESSSTISSEVVKIKQEIEGRSNIRIKKKGTTDITEVKEENDESKWEPTDWQQLLENIRTMRSTDTAPVDTMGCHKCADTNADEKTQRFHKLVALMLSSQTKDETTYHAMLRLREHSLTPEVISEMKVNVLENILHPVSFYKNKAKYLQQTSKILIEKYSSDIPNNIKELVALPGVGPKMAHICMATAWHQTTGIGVDVHVHRISNRLQWVPRPTKEPEQTRVALESWLPRDLWKEVNHLLVGFGQTTCTPLKPKCLVCLNCNICPAAPKTMIKQEKRENVEVMNICDKAKFKKSKMHI